MGSKITLLTRSEKTGKIKPTTVDYDGAVDAKVWDQINYQFMAKEPDEYFFPNDAMDVYNRILAKVEAKGRLIAEGTFKPENASPETYLVGVAKLEMMAYHHHQVKPLRKTYRLLERTARIVAAKSRSERKGNAAEGADVGGEAYANAIECNAAERIAPFGELRSGTPMSVRRERAFNRIAELLDRIDCTDHAMWKTLLTVAAAMILADGNMVEAAQLAGMSKSNWYRKWPYWRRWFRAAAREA